VSGPLNRYKDAIEYFTQHEVADYHKESMMSESGSVSSQVENTVR